MELTQVYLEYKPLLFSIAYQMTGSVTAAEDLVQDIFVTVQQQGLHEEEDTIRSLKAYLCKMITNRCIDYLRSARKQREVYTGPWLPEPLIEDGSSAASSFGRDPLQTVELQDTVSYALLVLLERLTPVERAVFILREAFAFDYKEIAGFINRTETGCRKIFSRLKSKIQTEPSAVGTFPTRIGAEQLVLEFLQAAGSGDMDALLALLAEDIVLYSDGGGKAVAAVKPIVSNLKVLAFIQGLLKKGTGPVTPVKMNGQTGFIITGSNEPFPTVVNLDIAENRVRQIFMLRNPDKLKHLISD